LKQASYLDIAQAVMLIETGCPAGASEILEHTDQQNWSVSKLKDTIQDRVSSLYSEALKLISMINPTGKIQKDFSLIVSPGTTIACTCCHRIDMPAYYLKRSNGKYDVLCFDNGSGCWEHSGIGLCSFIDRDEAQCMDLAEWTVVYGPNTDLSRKCVCSRHIPAVLGNASEYRIYPLDDPNKVQNYTSKE